MIFTLNIHLKWYKNSYKSFSNSCMDFFCFYMNNKIELCFFNQKVSHLLRNYFCSDPTTIFSNEFSLFIYRSNLNKAIKISLRYLLYLTNTGNRALLSWFLTLWCGSNATNLSTIFGWLPICVHLYCVFQVWLVWVFIPCCVLLQNHMVKSKPCFAVSCYSSLGFTPTCVKLWWCLWLLWLPVFRPQHLTCDLPQTSQFLNCNN